MKRQVVLVTKDINMRLKAKGAGLAHVEDYRSDQLIDDIRLLAKGFQVVPGSFWERVGECDSETHGRDTVHVIDANLLEGVHVNQYLLDEENFFAARVLEPRRQQDPPERSRPRAADVPQGLGCTPRTSIRAWRWMPCWIRTSTW